VFDRAYVQAHHIGGEAPLDVGALAEVALFYRDVELVLGRGTLRQLITSYGDDAVIEFVSQGYVNTHYSHAFTAIRSEHGPTEWHAPGAFGVNGDVEADVVHIFRTATGKSGRGRRKAGAFLEAVNLMSLSADWTDQIHANFANESLLRSAIEATARHTLGPGRGAAVHVTDLEWSDGRLRVEFDTTWPQLQAEYSAKRGEPLSTGLLLSPFVGSLTDLQVASKLGADISTGPLGSELLRLKCAELESATSGRLAGISDFQDRVLHGRDVRGAVNTGARDLHDVMDLLEGAHKFRNWLDDQPAGADLLEQYIEAATTETWASNLPVKALRFAGTSAAGFALGGGLGAAVGLVVGATDEFLIDRFLQGWRPNQFVEDELDPFVT
jgi:hypothetical protein